MLVDSRSSMDVFFCLTYNQIRLSREVFKPTNIPFYELSSYNVQPLRCVEFLVTASNHLTQQIVHTNFLVVDTTSVYNIIIGQPTLNALQVIMSTYHLAMKFPITVGVGVVYSSQVKACKCYALPLQRKREQSPQG